MAALSAEQVASLAYQAGFRDRALLIAVAVAQAESGFDPAAVNKTSGATGLWQILPSAHPEFDRAQLLDPAYNARAAYQVAGRPGGNPSPNAFMPWTAYKNGSFRRYLRGAENAVAAAARAIDPTGNYEGSGGASPAGNPAEVIGGAAQEALGEPLAIIGRFFSELLDPANWWRAGQVLLGAALAAGGAWFVIKDAALGTGGGS